VHGLDGVEKLYILFVEAKGRDDEIWNMNTLTMIQSGNCAHSCIGCQIKR